MNPCANDKDNYRRTFDCALRLLTRRDHSSHELMQKLSRRGFDADDIQRAVAQCRRLNYLDDERTAREFIRQRMRQGYGIRRIRYDLNRKGLRGERLEEILAASICDTEELIIARRVLRKKIKRLEGESDFFKKRDKLYRFLYARGFSEGVIIEVLKYIDQQQDDNNLNMA